MPTLQDVQDTALKYLNTPYKHQGRTQWGLDCAGLLAVTARDLGLPFRDRHDYPRRPRGNEFLDFIVAQMPDALDEPIPGTWGFFHQGGFTAHCGLFVLYRGVEVRLLHAFSPRRKVVLDNYEGTNWVQHLTQVRAMPGTI